MIYQRTVTAAINAHILLPEATVIIGARQTGKTTILKFLRKTLEDRGEQGLYFTLENPEYLALLNENPLNIFRLVPPSSRRTNVFLDEIQYLKNPSGFIKLLYDEHREKIKLIVSGSSAFFIDRKFTDSLAGRKRIFTLMTLSFREYLVFKNKDRLCRHLEQGPFGKTDYLSAIPLPEKEELVAAFRDYSRFGGYPRVALRDTVEEKKAELEELVTSYIKKDVAESGVRKEEQFFRLLRVLADRPGALCNMHELATTLRVSVSAVENFFYVIEKSFHGALVRPFFRNIRSELTKMPRFYFNDSGIRNFLANTFEDRVFSDGGALENQVFLQLMHRLSGESGAIKFWRTQSGSEVDFVLPEHKFALEAKCDPRTFKKNKIKLFTAAYPDIAVAVATWFDAAQGNAAIYPAWGL